MTKLKDYSDGVSIKIKEYSGAGYTGNVSEFQLDGSSYQAPLSDWGNSETYIRTLGYYGLYELVFSAGNGGVDNFVAYNDTYAIHTEDPYAFTGTATNSSPSLGKVRFDTTSDKVTIDLYLDKLVSVTWMNSHVGYWVEQNINGSTVNAADQAYGNWSIQNWGTDNSSLTITTRYDVTGKNQTYVNVGAVIITGWYEDTMKVREGDQLEILVKVLDNGFFFKSNAVGSSYYALYEGYNGLFIDDTKQTGTTISQGEQYYYNIGSMSNDYISLSAYFYEKIYELEIKQNNHVAVSSSDMYENGLWTQYGGKSESTTTISNKVGRAYVTQPNARYIFRFNSGYKIQVVLINDSNSLTPSNWYTTSGVAKSAEPAFSNS